jgi:translin
MKDLSESAEKAVKVFRDAEARRECAIRCSREIIRESKKMIHSIHLSEDHSVSKAELCRLVSELTEWIGRDPHRSGTGAADDALAEYAEAMILESVIEDDSVPSFTALGIGPGPWLLGLADCLGEMRRVVLTFLMSGDTQRAVSLFSQMEEISYVLMMFDVPDPILPIRRKQDIARSIMERTRTDIANAVVKSK